MRVIRSYWKDWPEGHDVFSEIPEVPMFNDVIYVYGEEAKADIPELEKRGYDVRHIEEEVFNKDGLVYGRKIISLILGLQDWGEVLMLDWDCVPVKPIDEKFMLYMMEKPTQVPLYAHPTQNPYGNSYKFNGVFLQPNFGFVYSRDKYFGNELLNLAIQYNIVGMTDEWAMQTFAKPYTPFGYIEMYHPKVCFGVDKDFFLKDPESESSKLQLPLIKKVEEQLGGMDIYFKHK